MDNLDNQVAWFQYKIIYYILDPKDYLYQVKLVADRICSCHMCPETTIHLLFECQNVADL